MYAFWGERWEFFWVRHSSSVALRCALLSAMSLWVGSKSGTWQRRTCRCVHGGGRSYRYLVFLQAYETVSTCKKYAMFCYAVRNAGTVAPHPYLTALRSWRCVFLIVNSTKTSCRLLVVWAVTLLLHLVADCCITQHTSHSEYHITALGTHCSRNNIFVPLSCGGYWGGWVWISQCHGVFSIYGFDFLDKTCVETKEAADSWQLWWRNGFWTLYLGIHPVVN